MNLYAIRGRNLHKQYGDFFLEIDDLTIRNGSIVGLIGENGAGKSTTIRLLLGLARSDSGTIELFGKPTDHGATTEMKEQIGFVMEDAWPCVYLNAKQTGAVMAKAYVHWDMPHYHELLKRLGVPPDKLFKDYSHGMKMKLALAIALSHRAKLLILDEPTSSLDPSTRDEILSMLMEFTRDEDHTVLFSSHIISDLEKLCDYITYIHNGKILFSKEKDRLSETYALATVSPNRFEDLDTTKILGMRTTPYEVKVLMHHEDVPAFMQIQRFNLEEMMILMAHKEEAV